MYIKNEEHQPDWANEARRTFRSREVDDVAITLEHVHLFDGLDGLCVQLLESGLELLVIVGAAGDVALLLVPRRALSTYHDPVNQHQPCDSRCRCRIESVGTRDGTLLDIPVRAGAAPPNFFLSSSWTSAMLSGNVWSGRGDTGRSEEIRVLESRRRTN